MTKPKSATTTTEVIVSKKVSRSAPSTRLEPAEEQALRMLHGIGLDPSAPLASKADGHPEAARELLRMEAQILHAMRQRALEVEVCEEEDCDCAEEDLGSGPPTPVYSRTKSKIVRALRKKI